MDLPAALDLAVARTGHKRFRELCDPAHPDYDRGYEAVVIALALGEPLPAPPAVVAPPQFPLAGDVVAALAARIGADRATRWLTKMFGVNCGCSDRQAWLNALDRKLRRWLGLGEPQ